jgi:hypothetical protein
MSSAGWHLESIDRIGLGFVFRRGEPIEYNYQQDFRAESKGKISEYLAFIEEAGWEHIVSYSGWHYFRKPITTGTADEFFSDSESKLEKYNRLKATFPLLYPFYLVIFLANLEKYPLWFAILLVSVFLLQIIFVSASLIGVTNRIKQLEAQARY